MKKSLQTKNVLRNALFILLLSLEGMGKGYAHDFTEGNLNYSVNTDGVSVTVTGHVNGTSATGMLNIPESVAHGGFSYAVTVIAENAFSGCTGLSGSLTIRNSVIAIGKCAFYGCSGMSGSLSIGNSVRKIEEQTFSGCSGFTGSLTIGNSVTEIGKNAFSGCSGFAGPLTIGNSVTKIGENAFYGCSSFSGELVLPNSVAVIEPNAFAYCGFTGSLAIPNTMTVIEYNTFAHCGFTGSLTLGNSLTTIGYQAFSGCSGFTGDLTIPNSVTMIDGAAFEGCSGFTGDLALPNTITKIGANAFYGCRGFTGTLTIPNSVTEIEGDAFSGCSNFSEVHYNAINCGNYGSAFINVSGTFYIGEHVRTIPARLFSCADFTGDLTIPNSVTSIGLEAFHGCRYFTGVLTIGNSVASIGLDAFSYCTGFTEVRYNAISCGDSYAPTNMYDSPFYKVQNTLVIGDNVEIIPAYMFLGSNFTGDLTIPNSVTSIGRSAFEGCSDFTGNLTIGNSVTTINHNAFVDCTGFTEVRYNATNCEDVSNPWGNIYSPFTGCGGTLTIGDNVERIPNNIFRDANFTGSLTIPNSVTTIKSYAFYHCSGFTGSLTLGNSLTTIGYQAFCGCSGFTGDLTIPNSVTMIDGAAFEHCSGFTGNLTIPNSVTYLGSCAFDGCSGFTGSLTIPNSVTTINAGAFSYCSGFTGSLTIPNSVITIEPSAFLGCSGFTGVLTLGCSVTEIGRWAFKDTAFDTAVAYGIEPPIIANETFSGMPFITAIIVPCGSKMDYFTNWRVFDYSFYQEDCIPRMVTINPNITGGMVVASVSQAAMGQEVLLTITPNAGMQLASIIVYNTNAQSQTVSVEATNSIYKFVMPIFNVTVTATFEPCDTYSIGISPDITGGRVTASVSEAVAGETVTLYVFPDPDYELWSLNVYNANNATQTVSVTNNTFVMPSFDVMVSAIFEHNSTSTHSISISPDITGGNVMASVSEAATGEIVALFVFPDLGFELRSLFVYNANNAMQTVNVVNSTFVMPPFDVMVSAVFNFTSVDEMAGKCVSVFPNPTSGQVKIEADGIRKITISNMIGQTIYEGNASGNTFEYDFSKHKAGIYLVRIETASGMAVKKVSVTR